MGTTHKIKQGENLTGISKMYNVPVQDIVNANGIKNPNLIIAGNTLTIPTISADNSKVEDAYAKGIESNTFSPSAETNTALSNKNKYDAEVAGYPDFTFTDQTKLDEYTKMWEERPDFNYDFNADALYQQYKDKYIQQGKMAMQDAIGQASAMTGGYGNSYAATVGNQAYQSSLQQLNDVIPELYQLAYNQHQQEGQDILDTISMLKGERELAMAEEAWNLEKQAYNSVAGGSSSGGSGSSGSGSSGSGNTTTASGGVPSNIAKAVQNYTTKEGQADYLAKQVSAGKISEDQAYQLLDSYGVTPLTERSWEMVDDGGINWFWGVDNNAVVRDETGKQYTLKELQKELEKTMKSSEAKDYIKKLQKQLGI